MKNIFSVEFFIKKNGSRGSVTVFLTMILVPMLLLMITLTDYAKISVAKRQVSGAGDVALNAGLSYYDRYLQDMYGLFAVSEDINSLNDNLEVYFKNTLLGEGIDTSDPFISKIVKLITDARDSDEAYINLINLTSHKFEIKEVEGANLINTALLSNQIMDYMKYRGPVVLVGGIFDKIGAFGSVTKETKAVQKKTEYEEKLEETGDKCKDAYNKINAYNQLIEENNFNPESIKEFENDLKKYYKQIITGIYLISKNKYAKPVKSERSDEKFNGYSLEELGNKLDNALKDGSAYMSKYKNHKNMAAGSDFVSIAKYLYSYNDLVSIFDENVRGAGDAFIKAADDFEDGIGDDEDLADAIEDIEKYINLYEEDGIEGGFDYEYLQEQYDNGDNTDGLSEYIIKLEYYYKNFTSWEDKDENERKTDKLGKLAKKYYKNLMGDEKYSEQDKNKEIDDSIDELNKRWDRYYERVSELKGKLEEYNKLKEKYNTHLSYYGNSGSLYKAAKDIKKTAENTIEAGIDIAKNRKKAMSDLVDNIKKSATNAKKAIVNIIDAFEELERKRDNWQGEINGLSGDSKASMQKDLDSEAGDLDVQEAKDCRDNLIQICEMLDKLKDDIEKFTFKKSNAERAAKDYEEIDIDGKRKPEAGSYYDSHYGNLSIDTSNVPGKVNEDNDKFYKYLKKLYGNDSKPPKSDKDYNKEKDELLKIDSKPENTDDTDKDSGGDESPAPESGGDGNGAADSKTKLSEKYTTVLLPSAEKKTAADSEKSTSVDKDKISSSLGNLADNPILSMITAFSPGNCVEDIYLTEYVMNMFTYRTYNKDSDGKKIEETSLRTLSDCGYNNSSILHGAEAEYVLWGLDSKKANLDATYATIFGIRFLMNTIYAFMDKSIRAQTTSAAVAIAGWTGFGVPIVKTALTVGLALLETKLDMDSLIKGKSVPVWKDSKTWVCSLDGFINKAADELIAAAADKAQELADNAIDNLHKCAADKMDELSGDLSKSLKDMTQDAIETVVGNITSAIEDRIMGLFNYGTDFSGMAVDEIKDGINEWTEGLKTSLGVPATEPDIKEDVTGYLLYKAYNEVINKESFRNDMADAIKKRISNENSKTAEALTEDIQKDVFKMCGIEKKEDGKGYKKVFGINTDQLIEDAVSGVNTKMQGYLSQGTETAKEKVNNLISGYSQKLVSAAHKPSGAGVSSTAGKSGGKSFASAITMDYSEYLTMMILLTGITKDGYQKHIIRTADLIQVNIGDTKKDSSFALKNCKTHLAAEATVSGSTFFAGTKYLQETDNIYLKSSNGLYGITYKGVDGY